eukprot:3358729-Pyramimonas_sp.AAC.1
MAHQRAVAAQRLASSSRGLLALLVKGLLPGSGSLDGLAPPLLRGRLLILAVGLLRLTCGLGLVSRGRLIRRLLPKPALLGGVRVLLRVLRGEDMDGQ